MTNGIRVAKSGYPVETATPPQLVYSSEYATLRVQQQGSGTITNSGGRTVTIAHNLGYVPMFLVHGDVISPGQYVPLPYFAEYNVLVGTYYNYYALTWADSTNIYIKLSDTFGYQYAYASAENDMAARDDEGTPNWSGCLRFESLGVAQGTSVAEAKVFFYTDQREGSGDIRIRIKGIEEADTAIFSSADDPYDRTETSAEVTKTIGGGVGVGSTDEWTITTIINEIVGQGGWASGNALGIKMWENTSDDNNVIVTTSGASYLKVLTSNTLLNYKYTIFKDKIE
jgi:hypothetical protein